MNKEELFISIIIPCFHEEEVINETYQQLKSVLEKENYGKYELIFINDGSTDTTLDILKKISKTDHTVKLLSFSRNFGHQTAVSAGIQHSSGNVAVITDADLQDPPELIPKMVNMYLAEKSNVIYAVRKKRHGESFFKLITAKLFYRIINKFSEIKLPLDTGDFRLIDKIVIQEFKKFREKNKYIRGLITWIGFKQTPLYYERNPRAAGQTKYPLSKMLKLATTGLMYFSKKPLKIAIYFGFTCSFISILWGLYILFLKLLNPANIVLGWASTIIVIIFFGGIQLLTIGIIGEYIGNVFDEVKNRPEYIISEKINF
ncbi:glycosyltransferase family 2 protein [Thermoproteota archaeon]